MKQKLKGKFVASNIKKKNKSHNNLRFHVRNQEKRINYIQSKQEKGQGGSRNLWN